MEVELFLKAYLQIFFMCGIIPYPFKMETENQRQKCKKLLQFIPVISVIILSFVVIFVWSNFYFSNEFHINIGNKNYIISTLFLFNLLITNVSTVFFGYYYRSVYRSIYDSLVNLEIFLKINFEKQLLFKHLSKSVKSKFFLVIFGDLLHSITNLSYDTEVKNEIYVVATMLIMLTIAYISCMNVIIHVDVIANVLRQMSEWLQEKNDLNGTTFEPKSNADSDEALVSQFKWIKYFYFDVWQYVERMNRYFGWIMMFFLLQMFLEFTFACYWIFMLIEKKWNLWEFMRKLELKQYYFHIFFFRSMRNENGLGS